MIEYILISRDKDIISNIKFWYPKDFKSDILNDIQLDIWIFKISTQH